MYFESVHALLQSHCFLLLSTELMMVCWIRIDRKRNYFSCGKFVNATRVSLLRMLWPLQCY
jgi:hypothetical protein